MHPKLWEDTSPAAERVLLDGYRRMSSVRKARQISELTRGAQQMALARLRGEDPGATERELQLRLAALWLPADLLERVVLHAQRVEARRLAG